MRPSLWRAWRAAGRVPASMAAVRSEEHTSELQSQSNLVCRLLLEKKKKKHRTITFPRPHLWTNPYFIAYLRSPSLFFLLFGITPPTAYSHDLHPLCIFHQYARIQR